MAAIGRPTDCTPEMIERMADKLREVGCIETALAFMPFSRTSHYEWCERGRMGEDPFADYADAVERARAEFFERNLIGPAVAASQFLEEEEVNRKTGEIVTLKKPGDLRAMLDLAKSMRPDLFNPNSKAHQFRTTIETMQRFGVRVDERAALRIAGIIWGIDPADLRMGDDGGIETKDERKKLAIKFLRDLDQVGVGSNGKASG